MTETACKRVLVTGASGYIGSHVVQQLLAAGHVVRGTVRNKTDPEKVGHLLAMCAGGQGQGRRLELVEVDLLKAETWLPAVEGMDVVIHTACPYPDCPPEGPHEDEVLKPAVQGTLHVLRACREVKAVTRVVMTSCVTAVNWSTKTKDQIFTEESWSNPKDVDSVTRSKILAEKAAWDYVKNLPDDRRLELVVLNPSITLGPPLHHTHGTSTKLVQKLLDQLIPGVPKMNFPVIDVRDVARAHLLAMTSPQAAGHRHIIHNDNMWMSEMANLLHRVFSSQGYKIPTLVAPNMVMKVAAKLDANVRVILPHLGVVHRFNNSRMREVLGLEPRNLRDTVVEMAHAMIQNGLAHKTVKYTGDTRPNQRDSYLSMKL